MRKESSPCTKVCQIDEASGLCTGCYRTLDEIAGWGAMSPDKRRAVMATLDSRAVRLSKKPAA